MQILVGTRNPAKFERYRTILQRIPEIEVCSFSDIQLSFTVEEDGLTAEENARKKARIYADAAHIPTLSIDEALSIDGLPADEQPGVYVRRYGGKAATDEEMLALYLAKVREIPPEKRGATWIYAICLAFPAGKTFIEHVEVPTVFTDVPCLPLLPGYPLSSLQRDPATGKYLREYAPEEEHTRLSTLYEAVEKLVWNAVISLNK